MDPLFKTLHYMRLRKYESCSESCKLIPSQNQREKWYIICKIRSEESYYDFTEPDELSASDIVFEEGMLEKVPRPGTSLRTGMVGSRLTSGYMHSSQINSRRVGAAPTTSSTSHFTRLATASLAFNGEEPDITSINIEKFAKNPFLARILIDYLLQRLRDPIRAVQLSASCTKLAGFDDWWWKNRLGRAYYQLGLYPEAEAQFKSSLYTAYNIESRLELAKLYLRIDQPNKAISELQTGYEQFPHEIKFLLAQAQLCESIGDIPKARDLWRKVLQIDQASIEAIASIGASSFYEDQPETSFKFYSYLRKLGIVSEIGRASCRERVFLTV